MKDKTLLSEFSPVSTQEWEAVIEKDLKGADYEKKLVWNTIEGFKVKPYYRAEDLEDIAYLNTNPNEYPFTRGQKSDGNTWDIRQDIEEKDICEINKLALQAIERGVNSLGLNAVKAANAEDMKALLKGIDLEKIKINFTSSKSYIQTARYFIEEVNSQGIDKTKVAGSFKFDMFAYALLNGDFWGTEEVNYEELVKIIELIDAEFPKFRCITVNATVFHNAGANITQELAYALAEANEYMASLTDKGLKPESVSTNIAFSFAVGSNYFMEIAKIRAARMLWTKIVEQYNPMCTCAYNTFIHSTSSLWNKSVYDPYVNMLRTTTETMSSVIGGADSISVSPFDVAYKNPDEFSYRIARNQQIILKEESYLDKVVDPVAGSYYIENLTDSIASYAWEMFKEIEAKGGFSQAIKSGYIQSEIEKMAQKRNMDIATRKISILGTNQYPNLNEHMNDKIETDNVFSCHDNVNGLIPRLKRYRAAEEFENLRLTTEERETKPKVFLFTYGNLGMRKARAGFATNFFGVAGYEILDNSGFPTVDEGIKAALDSKAEIVVLCSSDDEYPEIVPAIGKALKGKTCLVLAGYPKEHIEAFRNEGIDEFIHVKSNVLEVLKGFQRL